MPKDEQFDEGFDISKDPKFMELKELFLIAARREVDLMHPRVRQFTKEIQKKYPPEKYNNSKLWHLLIGSTPGEKDVDFDVPDGDIENFIRNELPKIEPEDLEDRRDMWEK